MELGYVLFSNGSLRSSTSDNDIESFDDFVSLYTAKKAYNFKILTLNNDSQYCPLSILDN